MVLLNTNKQSPKINTTKTQSLIRMTLHICPQLHEGSIYILLILM